MRVCDVIGCLSPHSAKGFCERHYYLVRMNGVPIPRIIRGDDEARFWSYVEITNSCWLWSGSRNKGYGCFRVGSKVLRAHRYAYELMVGKLSDKLVLDHLCKTKYCVNPEHMEEVTTQENTKRYYLGRVR